MKNVLAVLLAGLICFAGCTNMVTINSVPQGAKCFVYDGSDKDPYRGETPLTTEVTSWAMGSTPTVELKKGGYPNYKTELQKRTQVGYIVMDILFFLPGLFMNTSLVDGEYTFYLQK